MPLPKINHTIFEVDVLSLGKKVKFRPFLVKEEKLILIAKESDDLKEVFRCIKQIINNCCLEELDVDSLPVFDIEMIFANLRINSVGENIQMTYTCEQVNNDVTCGYVTNFDLTLRDIQYETPKEHNRKIQLTDTVGLVLNYPTFDPTDELEDKDEFEFLMRYVDYIYDEAEVYKASETPKEELSEFFESLTKVQIEEIRKFFMTTPKVVLKKDITCGKCSHVHNLSLEGVLNFFD
jgi:hypothetical protein